ncbi:hypothetical protein AKJ38_03450 [candidate division MSBL1 archaeon SCGC-AAA259I14]|uniref:Integrase catalytic domain-containing protein n=2 Tax=candidate division MSBL1 TaxID=215777 RepID=A0A133UQ31_9EURY|nr:hypothetical protein AKJ38_03450 [candidate division MSBL1 archaeon SCGC-AAA259I14]
MGLRKLIVEKVSMGFSFSKVADIFGTTRQTVSKWYHRWKNGEGLEDRSRRPRNIERKVKDVHERAIGALRDAFNWGTERLRRALALLPEPVRKLLRELGIEIDPIQLSRETINKVLQKLGLNGSPYGGKHEYQSFERDEPNDLWQLDIRGPFRLEYMERYAIFGVDDHSRFAVCAEMTESTPTTKDVKEALKKSFKRYRKPNEVLIDRGGQFRDKFERFCEEEGIEIVKAPPRYPQIKGKVERFKRTFNEEYLVLQEFFDNVEEYFPEWIHDYNHNRPNMGIGNKPPASRFKTDKN